MDYLVPAILLFIALYPACKVVKKMGHHPLLGLFVLIPYVNILMFYVFATTKWPVEYEYDELIKENARLKEIINKAESLSRGAEGSSGSEEINWPVRK